MPLSCAESSRKCTANKSPPLISRRRFVKFVLLKSVLLEKEKILLPRNFARRTRKGFFSVLRGSFPCCLRFCFGCGSAAPCNSWLLLLFSRVLRAAFSVPAFYSGSTTRNVVPFPSSLSTSILPRAPRRSFCSGTARCPCLFFCAAERPKEHFVDKFLGHAAAVICNGEHRLLIMAEVSTLMLLSFVASYAFITRLVTTFCICRCRWKTAGNGRRS